MQTSEEGPQLLKNDIGKTVLNLSPCSQSKKAKSKFVSSQQNPLLEKPNFGKQKSEMKKGDSLASVKPPKSIKKEDCVLKKPPKGKILKKYNSRSDRYCKIELPKSIKPINKIFGSLEDFINFFSKRSPEILNFAKLFKEIEESNDINELNEKICPELENCIIQEFIKINPDQPSDKVLLPFQKKAQVLERQKKEELISSFQKHFQTFEEFFAQVLKVYTMNTFLFRNLNQYLRDEDWKGIGDLLPYAFCLCKAFFNEKLRNSLEAKQQNFTTLYRGTELDEAAIQHFDPDTVQNFSWYAVTSTTKKEEMIEKFILDQKKCVIFVIQVPITVVLNTQHSLRYLDVSKYSAYPEEEEVLLPPGSVFQLIGKKKDENERTIIIIRLLDNVKSLAYEGLMMQGSLQTEMMTDQISKNIGLEGEELCEALKNISGNSLIEEVEFNLCTFDNFSQGEMIKTLSTLKRASKLKFISCSYKDEGKMPNHEVKDFSAFKIEICEINDFYKIFGTSKSWTSLKDLNIDFRMFNKVKNEDLFILASQTLQNLTSLKSLKLDFCSCFYITSEGIKSLTSFGLRHLDQLKSLNLDFSYCPTISDAGIKNLGSEGLKYLTQLTSLSLIFINCHKISMKGMDYLFSQGLKNLVHLELLDLDLSGCHRKISEHEIERSLSRVLENLPKLQLNFTSDKPHRHQKQNLEQAPPVNIPEKFICERTLNIPNQFSCSNFERKLYPETVKSNREKVFWLIHNVYKLESMKSEREEEDFQDNSTEKGSKAICRLRYSLSSDPLLSEYNKKIQDQSKSKSKHLLHLVLLDLNFSDCLYVADKETGMLFLRGLNHFYDLKSLSLNFAHCSKITDNLIFNMLFEGFENLTQLTSLHLNFAGLCLITDKGIHHLCSAGLKSLTQLASLELILEGCSQLTDQGIKNLCFEGLKNLPNLKSLGLSLKRCYKMTYEGMEILNSEGLAYLTNLTSLNLSFSHWASITDEEIRNLCSEGLIHLPQLESLSLNFSHCSEITDEGIYDFCSQGIQKLFHLNSVYLNFSYCAKITAKGMSNLFSKGWNHLNDLTSLDLNFSACTEITDKEIQSLDLKRFTKLTFLSLDFSFCKEITDKGLNNLFCEGLRSLKILTFLNLNFNKCAKITDEGVNSLCSKGLRNISQLRELNVSFEDCDQITSFTLMNMTKVLKYFGFEIL